MVKKRSKFLSEQELDLLDIGEHIYVKTWDDALAASLRDEELRGLRDATLFYYKNEMGLMLRILGEQKHTVEKYT
jgi:hypothetical protein